jgi:hypothetical protein
MPEHSPACEGVYGGGEAMFGVVILSEVLDGKQAFLLSLNWCCDSGFAASFLVFNGMCVHINELINLVSI